MENFTVSSPLGRPRCEQSTTDSAPPSRAYLLDNLSHWWHGELLNLLTIWSAKVRAKYDRLGTIVKDNLSPWWHGELLNLLTIWSAKARAKYDRLGTILKGTLDGQP